MLKFILGNNFNEYLKNVPEQKIKKIEEIYLGLECGAEGGEIEI